VPNDYVYESEYGPVEPDGLMTPVNPQGIPVTDQSGQRPLAITLMPDRTKPDEQGLLSDAVGMSKTLRDAAPCGTVKPMVKPAATVIPIRKVTVNDAMTSDSTHTRENRPLLALTDARHIDSPPTPDKERDNDGQSGHTPRRILRDARASPTGRSEQERKYDTPDLIRDIREIPGTQKPPTRGRKPRYNPGPARAGTAGHSPAPAGRKVAGHYPVPAPRREEGTERRSPRLRSAGAPVVRFVN
jgi:hypothetical protein